MGFVDSVVFLARATLFLVCMQKVTSQECTMSGPLECKNGGTCNVDDLCMCLPGFIGAYCEATVCMDSIDCLNGGTCMTAAPPDPNECICADGFEGIKCDRQNDVPATTDSDDVPCGGGDEGYCYNDGVCEPLVQDSSRYKCRCPTDYVGPQCEDYRICSASNRCLNNGNCVDERCQCLPGFSGALCEIACTQNSECLNLATCDVMMGECVCYPGYTGPKCGIDESGPLCLRDSDCRNGGTCDEDDGICTCIKEFKGHFCEIVPEDSTVIIAVSVAVAVLVIIAVIVLVVCLMKHRSKRRNQSDNGHVEMASRSKPNDYIGVSGGQRSSGSSGSLLKASNYEPDGKEFPRELLHIMGQLGAGSFATVHRAEADGIIQKGVMTTVAVKMLKTTATETDKSDFNKERNMYLNLGFHPNVVTMLGFCTEQEPYFLIMEYLPNGNLQSYLRHVRTGSKGPYGNLNEETKRNFLLPEEILSFANMIANGMEFLSSKLCIHRDLATRNILLGDDLVAKVSDFGLARDIQDERQYEMKSRGRVPVRWMAPESLLDNLYTTKSDVWGYAVLMWELVTLGSHPYPGMSSREVMDKVQAGYRLPKPEHCSDEIYDLMTQCWNKDPDDRPTFTELCAQLDRMMADASGYLIMSDLKKDDYLYLEPNQTKSVNTGDDF